MHYVILRDDDTNALTPPEYLERLYRPFLARGLAVNLATIPNVCTDVRYGEGILEGFLLSRNGVRRPYVPIGQNRELIAYLRGNPGFHIVQHGYHHEFVGGRCEFDQSDREDIIRRMECGRALLRDAGLGVARTFVAPYDLFTRVSLEEAASRFWVISTGWLEWKRMPARWWLDFLANKTRRRSHWRHRGTTLLTHPGSYVSYRRPCETMLESIQASIVRRRLTVLVTHWWEFFPENVPNERMIAVLHELAEFLARSRDIKVVAFADVEDGRVPLN